MSIPFTQSSSYLEVETLHETATIVQHLTQTTTQALLFRNVQGDALGCVVPAAGESVPSTIVTIWETVTYTTETITSAFSTSTLTEMDATKTVSTVDSVATITPERAFYIQIIQAEQPALKYNFIKYNNAAAYYLRGFVYTPDASEAQLFKIQSGTGHLYDGGTNIMAVTQAGDVNTLGWNNGAPDQPQFPILKDCTYDSEDILSCSGIDSGSHLFGIKYGGMLIWSPSDATLNAQSSLITLRAFTPGTEITKPAERRFILQVAAGSAASWLVGKYIWIRPGWTLPEFSDNKEDAVTFQIHYEGNYLYDGSYNYYGLNVNQFSNLFQVDARYESDKKISYLQCNYGSDNILSCENSSGFHIFCTWDSYLGFAKDQGQIDAKGSSTLNLEIIFLD
ncbi:hypothetical protein GQ53DRAFT_815141 [Thozetella sp. PMI_491]|nr:hypothetical protein GQ53DRAFT_815141 [Thozetella sp. PMI_491]